MCRLRVPLLAEAPTAPRRCAGGVMPSGLVGALLERNDGTDVGHRAEDISLGVEPVTAADDLSVVDRSSPGALELDCRRPRRGRASRGGRCYRPQWVNQTSTCPKECA